MKICIVSDSHDHRDHLAAAVAEAKNLGAQAVIHCGDLVAPSTLHADHPARAADPSGARQQPGRPVSPVETGAQTGEPRALLRPGWLVHARGQAPLSSCTTRTTPRPWRSPATTTWCATATSTRPSSNALETSRGRETLRVDPGTVGGVSRPATYVLGDLEKMEFVIRSVPEPTDERAARPRAATG